MVKSVAVMVVERFNYEDLGVELRTVIRQKVSEIETFLRLNTQNAIEIGYRLAEIKASLPHGQWQSWLAAEFPRSQDTAARWMALAAASQNPQIADFEPSAAYELAAGGDDAIDAAAEIAESRGKLTTKQAKELSSKAPPEFVAGQTAYVAIDGHDRDGEAVQIAEVQNNLIRVMLPNNQIVPLLPSELSSSPPQLDPVDETTKERQSTPVDALRFDLEVADERILFLEAENDRLKAENDRLKAENDRLKSKLALQPLNPC